jgi:hypothetical protein
MLMWCCNWNVHENFKKHFVDLELINALAIVYPQFWIQQDEDFYFYNFQIMVSSKDIIVD